MILKIRTLISLKNITGLVPLVKIELVLFQMENEFLYIVEMKLRHESTCKRTHIRLKQIGRLRV